MKAKAEISLEVPDESMKEFAARLLEEQGHVIPKDSRVGLEWRPENDKRTLVIRWCKEVDV